MHFLYGTMLPRRNQNGIFTDKGSPNCSHLLVAWFAWLNFEPNWILSSGARDINWNLVFLHSKLPVHHRNFGWDNFWTKTSDGNRSVRPSFHIDTIDENASYSANRSLWNKIIFLTSIREVPTSAKIGLRECSNNLDQHVPDVRQTCWPPLPCPIDECNRSNSFAGSSGLVWWKWTSWASFPSIRMVTKWGASGDR